MPLTLPLSFVIKKKGHKDQYCHCCNATPLKLFFPATTHKTHTSHHSPNISSAPPTRSQTAPSRILCHVHKLCGHSMDECHSVQRLIVKSASAPSQSGNQSGKAKRQPQNHPSFLTSFPHSPLPSVPSIVAAFAKDSWLTFQCFTHGISLSLGADTGASVTLLSESVFQTYIVDCLMFLWLCSLIR